MKKVLLTKSKSNNVLDNTNKNMYSRRKAMQPAYQELFQALLKLPDRQVADRVLDAINYQTDEEIIQTCEKCKAQKIKKILVDVGTQTINEELPVTNKSNSEDITNIPTTLPSSTNNDDDNGDDSSKVSVNKDEPQKRKQRRKIRVPQVIKKSQAKQLLEHQQPFAQKRKAKVIKPNGDVQQTPQETSFAMSKRCRSDSISSMDIEEMSAHVALWDAPHDVLLKTMIKTMLGEYEKAEEIQADGLLPIHSAIMNDDLSGLKRQIFLWKRYKKIDLNELCTEDDEDCLQLAIIHNKSHPILNELIASGLDLNCFDSQSNSLIHLAVLNEVDIENFQLLMDRIDLEILHKLNDDGYTPLHLAVRHDNFLMTEILLNTIDKFCFGRLIYERQTIDEKESFLEFYENCCEPLELEKTMLQDSKGSEEKQKIKRRVIDLREIRSGSTALLYAIENRLEHHIYLLLAHFADPRVENHSGQSSRTYLGEFAKTLNLSLKIDRIMEQIENLLE